MSSTAATASGTSDAATSRAISLRRTDQPVKRNALRSETTPHLLCNTGRFIVSRARAAPCGVTWLLATRLRLPQGANPREEPDQKAPSIGAGGGLASKRLP